VKILGCHPAGGWRGISLASGREVRVKSGHSIRGPWARPEAGILSAAKPTARG